MYNTLRPLWGSAVGIVHLKQTSKALVDAVFYQAGLVRLFGEALQAFDY